MASHKSAKIRKFKLQTGGHLFCVKMPTRSLILHIDQTEKEGIFLWTLCPRSEQENLEDRYFVLVSDGQMVDDRWLTYVGAVRGRRDMHFVFESVEHLVFPDKLSRRACMPGKKPDVKDEYTPDPQKVRQALEEYQEGKYKLTDEVIAELKSRQATPDTKLKRNRLEWKPISTAPHNMFVLVACESGYRNVEWIYRVAIFTAGWHNRWDNEAGDSLENDGHRPLWWTELPEPPQ